MALFEPSQMFSWLFFILIFVFILPKFMLYKMIAEMDSVARKLEGYTRESVDIVVKTSKDKGKPTIDPKETVENSIEFFLIPPVSLDPYGILKKLEHVLDKSEDRFEQIVGRIAPESDEIWKANITSLLKGAIGMNSIAKIVRHYVEFVKKTGNLQIAMIIQMQLPILKKIAKAHQKGIKAISEGKPIGDSIGPLVTANLIKGVKTYDIAKDVICGETKLCDRKVYVIKAKGPGATLGKLGDAVQKLGKKKIAKIITIDASLKLEGEETGKVSEGMGAAIGDPGPEKAKMEEIAMKLNIPLEAIIIKMSIEEAISDLTKKIGESVQKTIDFVEDAVERTEKKGSILVVGVGNTCGIGNSFASVKDLQLPEEEKEKKEKSFLDILIKKFAEKMVEKEELKEELKEKKKEEKAKNK